MTNPEPRIRQSYFVPPIGNGQSVTTARGNIGVANSAVVAADAVRTKITFHNPNPAISLIVSQTTVEAGTVNNPVFGSPGGGFLMFAGTDREFTGDIAKGAWQACAESGSANGLTVVTSRE